MLSHDGEFYVAIAGPLLYNIKHLQATVAVIWCHKKKKKELSSFVILSRICVHPLPLLCTASTPTFVQVQSKRKSLELGGFIISISWVQLSGDGWVKCSRFIPEKQTNEALMSDSGDERSTVMAAMQNKKPSKCFLWGSKCYLLGFKCFSFVWKCYLQGAKCFLWSDHYDD